MDALALVQPLSWDDYRAWWTAGPRAAGPSLELVLYGTPTCGPCGVLKRALQDVGWAAMPVCLQGHVWSLNMHARPDDDDRLADGETDPADTVTRFPTMVLLSRGHPTTPTVRVEGTWVRPQVPVDWSVIVAAAQAAQYALQSDALDAAFAM